MWIAKLGVLRSTAPSRKRERERESSPGGEPEAIEEDEEKKLASEEKRVRTAKTSGDDVSPVPTAVPSEKPKPKDESLLHPKANPADSGSGPRSSVEGQRSVSPTQPPPLSASAGDATPPDPEVEIVRISVPEGKKKARNVESGSGARTPVGIPIGTGVPAPVIDVRWEASKLPLDVAIFNSARAAGGVDRIKKFLQVVVIVGGTSIIPGMVHALESRCVHLALLSSPHCPLAIVLRWSASDGDDARQAVYHAPWGTLIRSHFHIPL